MGRGERIPSPLLLPVSFTVILEMVTFRAVEISIRPSTPSVATVDPLSVMLSVVIVTVSEQNPLI